MRSISILLASLCCLVLPPTSYAQVFIPDQDERNWLNSEIPGIVDVNGIMDTLHPGIADLDTAMYIMTTLSANKEIRGIGYLYALTWVYAGMSSSQAGISPPTQASTITIDRIPASLKALHIWIYNDYGWSLSLPELPDHMDKRHIESTSHPGEVTIADIPDTLGSLTLNSVRSIAWNGTPHIGTISLLYFGGFDPYQLFQLPILSCNDLYVYGVLADVWDLSQVSTDHLSFGGSEMNTTMIWPAEVHSIETAEFTLLHGPQPNFPEGLEELHISTGGGFDCLPLLPEGLTTLDAWSAGFSCLPNWPSTLQNVSLGCCWSSDDPFTEPSAENAIYCSVLNTTCSGANPGISGRLFVDADSNGQYDTGEIGLPQATVVLQPNGNSAPCEADGTWEVGVYPGAYTMVPSTSYPYIASITPSSHTASVPNLGDSDVYNDFAVSLIPDIQDLRVNLYADVARPGFDNQVHLRCENYGTMPVDAELTLAFDADQTWLGSSIAPASSSSNTATWNFPAMPIGAVQHIVVDLTTAATVVLGTDITHTLTADPIGTDETPLNNVYTFNDSVVGSYDPNDKLLSPAVLTPTEVALEETPIEYTIRFQNTGTFQAERVVILDTLSQDLQWESMRFIASSHENTWYIVDGVLHVIHNDIMLPDSNANEPESHGFFKFSMLPKTDLGNGSTIENIAHIVFDFNTPIITPPAVFTVDVAAGLEAGSTVSELRLLPNPAHDRIQLFGAEDTMLPYRIVDLLGQEVQRGTAPPNAWIEVQGLANGSYVLEATKAGVPTSLRFMKQ